MLSKVAFITVLLFFVFTNEIALIDLNEIRFNNNVFTHVPLTIKRV